MFDTCGPNGNKINGISRAWFRNAWWTLFKATLCLDYEPNTLEIHTSYEVQVCPLFRGYAS